MEQQFQLKHYGKLTIFEQNQMTSEERSWFLKRLEREFKERQDKEAKDAGNMPKPRTSARR